MSSVQLLCSLLLVSMGVNSVCGQTFQYSRGWINGKRSDQAVQSLNRGVQQPEVIPGTEHSTSDVIVTYDDTMCSTDQRDIVILTRDKMMQLITHAIMHSLRSVKVTICVNQDTKSTHLQAIF